MKSDMIDFNNTWSLVAARKRSKKLYEEWLKEQAKKKKSDKPNDNSS